MSPSESATGGSPPELATVGGRVHGFKLPPERELGPDEEEVAIVSVAYRHIYEAPPLGSFPSVEREVEVDGGPFSFQVGNLHHMTFFAKYGIRNRVSNAFEPLLFGYSDGVTITSSGETITDADIILDMRLDVDVPVSLLDPPEDATDSVDITAFLDLGRDGVIPLSKASNTDDPSKAMLTQMPDVPGESLIFRALGHDEGRLPYSIAFHRQPGSVASGVTIGPLLGTPTFLSPAFPFFGFGELMEWKLEPSTSKPDIIFLRIFKHSWDTPDIPLWHAVIPGSETKVIVPKSIMDRIRAKYPYPEPLGLQFTAGTIPGFDFGEWSYADTYISTMPKLSVDALSFFPSFP